MSTAGFASWSGASTPFAATRNLTCTCRGDKNRFAVLCASSDGRAQSLPLEPPGTAQRAGISLYRNARSIESAQSAYSASHRPALEARDTLLAAFLRSSKERKAVSPAVLIDCIRELEALQQRPMTSAFAQLAVAGNWSLLLSTSPSLAMPSGAPSAVSLARALQIIDVDNNKLANVAQYAHVPSRTTGQLVVQCKLGFDQKASSRLHIELGEHQLIPGLPLRGSDNEPLSEGKAPSDISAVVNDLRRVLPMEFFDPDSSLQDVTYSDPDMRIVRFMDQNRFGVLNVFIRNRIDQNKKLANIQVAG